MATLYISEFQQGVSGIGTTWAQMLPQPAISNQTVSISASSAQSVAFNDKTKAVMLSTDTACCIRFGSDPTAAQTDFFLPANVLVSFSVEKNSKVAVRTP